VQKKADNEDFKKGIKYLDQKLKEVYSYVKEMEEEETNNMRPQTQTSTYTRSGFLKTKKQWKTMKKYEKLFFFMVFW
jgi:hypothetical protein